MGMAAAGQECVDVTAAGVRAASTTRALPDTVYANLSMHVNWHANLPVIVQPKWALSPHNCHNSVQQEHQHSSTVEVEPRLMIGRVALYHDFV